MDATDLEAIAELVRRVVREEIAARGVQLDPAAYTIELAARKLSMGRRSVEKMMQRGELNWCWVGKRRMIPAHEIRRLTNAVEGPPPPRPRRKKARPVYNADAEIEAAKKLKF